MVMSKSKNWREKRLRTWGKRFMSKIVVLYQSKYGSTRKYAQWLAGELACDLIETKKARLEQVQNYDVVILGGGVYASGILGFSFLKKNFSKLKEKKLAVFAVGASPYDEKMLDVFRAHNFKGELARIPLFYCRGAWNEEKMTWLDRKLCGMLKRMVAKKDPATYEPWEAALMEASGNCDWTDQEALKPIIEYVQA